MTMTRDEMLLLMQQRVALRPRETMTRAEILKQYKIWDTKISTFQPLRFGQWFLNTFHPTMAEPEIYYCRNDRKALNMILNDASFCSETYK